MIGAPAIGALGVAALLVMLFLRVPVWVALVIVGVGGNVALSGWPTAFAVLGMGPFDTVNAYTLSVIPQFILMGEIAAESRLSADLFAAARVWLAGLRGGLAIAAIGAVCGSSIATAATITRIAVPEMRRAGYHDSLATGAIAAGGTIGILVPPSIILVIYGSIAEQSVPKLFAAALLPAIVLMLLYVLIAMAVATVRPHWAPSSERLSWGRRLEVLRGPWQFLVLFIVTIGGIYAGVFSPTEAASIGAFGAIVLGFLARRLTWAQVTRSVGNATTTSCVLFLIIIAANLFSNFIVQTQLPPMLATEAEALHMPGLLVLVLVVLAYLVMGCFLEGIGMVLITVPVFLPLVTHYGYDPIWFGIIVVIVVEVGLIHPPVGMNLFVVQAQARDIKITSIYKGILPFLIAPLVLIVLMFLFPELGLMLPRALYG
jgi:C4-dicarboxylate transporter DctM subunit